MEKCLRKRTRGAAGRNRRLKSKGGRWRERTRWGRPEGGKRATQAKIWGQRVSGESSSQCKGPGAEPGVWQQQGGGPCAWSRVCEGERKERGLELGLPERGGGSGGLWAEGRGTWLRGSEAPSSGRFRKNDCGEEWEEPGTGWR